MLLEILSYNYWRRKRFLLKKCRSDFLHNYKIMLVKKLSLQALLCHLPVIASHLNTDESSQTAIKHWRSGLKDTIRIVELHK